MNTVWLSDDEIGIDHDFEHLFPGGHVDAGHNVDRSGLCKPQGKCHQATCAKPGHTLSFKMSCTLIP